jgi:nucleoid DNA-binding protein
MRKRHGWALAALGGAILLTLVLAGPARSQRPPLPPRDLPLPAAIAAGTGVKEADVAKVLQALGPTLADRLARGQTVEIPGLGVFRVVRIPEHRDLVDGRPVLTPATNSMDFLPAQNVQAAANAPGAVPAVTVPQFMFYPLPDRTPSLYTPGTRMPSSRIP